MKILLYGLATGILFGFFLQKGRVLRYDKQVGALRLIDMTILKFMLSTILVSMVGVYALSDLGMVQLQIKPLVLGPIVVGGFIFGAGWGLLGYCPGTSLGALGEGRWDALWGIFGMVAGSALYAEIYPLLDGFLALGNFGSITIPGALGVNHWFIIPLFVVGTIFLFRWFEKKRL